MEKENLRIILLVELSRPIGRDLVRGIIRYSRLYGPWSFYAEQLWIKDQINKVKDWKADAVVVHYDDENVLNKVSELNIPTISTNGFHKDKFPQFNDITGNNFQIGKIAAEYFLNRGFKNFAYCGAALPTSWSTQRAASFKEHIFDKHNNPTFSDWISTDIPKWDLEQKTMAQWLLSLPKPVAVFACNDERGQHVLNACRLADIKVPFEVAVLGVDNDDILCNLSDPPLSSIVLNFEKAGFQTAQAISDLARPGANGKKEITIEPVNVITRLSTDITAIEDKTVLSALNFIKKNADKAVQVSDVAAYIGMTERGLQKKFHKALDTSVMKEINRVRIDEFCDLLVKTDLTLWEIAGKLGFSSFDNISRFFQSQIGMPPTRYRKLHKL